MTLLHLGDFRHGVGDFAEKGSQGVLLGANFAKLRSHLGPFRPRFGKFGKDALALLGEELEIDVFRFISHSVIMLPWKSPGKRALKWRLALF